MLEIHRVSREAIPKAPADASEVLRVAGEYARRGQLGLLRHNLAAARLSRPRCGEKLDCAGDAQIGRQSRKCRLAEGRAWRRSDRPASR